VHYSYEDARVVYVPVGSKRLVRVCLISRSLHNWNVRDHDGDESWSSGGVSGYE
jgi:hypothetical protein